MPDKKKTLSEQVGALKTGELFVEQGLICPEDIDRVLLIQAKMQDSPGLIKNRLFGMILCDLNLVTPVDNYCVLHKYNKLVSIQSALISKKTKLKEMVSKNMISREKVLNAHNASLTLDLPFISLLLKDRVVSISEMQQLLFGLFHIPFRSIIDFVFNEADRTRLVNVLDKHDSLENRMIPLVLKGHTILIGITDPENLLFIQKLNNRFPQYRFKAVFISFSGFSRFYGIIYKTNIDHSSSGRTPLDLPFLLSFKTSIKDPEQENESIQTLYDRYELLRRLSGNPKRDNQQIEFNEFIVCAHKKITREYKSRCIEFSLKQQGRDVNIIAFPKQ
ncbi:GspE/PulE family protein [Desulfobacula phenolica]|uniref:Type II secretion system (T2SS), protein E, N-terminal domain n=1 Tax=Desulfobacula phenolica TaxID=90732 RepID=A0A1H2JL43_9BACT|nr:hypothetical protein [Desulfobacula phenolica]SDU57199.1 hypothetical protein SAMN04487931_11375 [Desulfobacula phenolica]